MAAPIAIGKGKMSLKQKRKAPTGKLANQPLSSSTTLHALMLTFIDRYPLLLKWNDFNHFFTIETKDFGEGCLANLANIRTRLPRQPFFKSKDSHVRLSQYGQQVRDSLFNAAVALS